MNIPYVENDVSESIEMLIDVDGIMDFLISNGHVSNPVESYAENSFDMCNIFTFIIGTELNQLCEEGSIIVKEGVFGMQGNHTWLEVEGCIVDATLTQFISDARPLSIIATGFDPYTSVYEYEFSDWILKSSNVNVGDDYSIEPIDIPSPFIPSIDSLINPRTGKSIII